MRIIKNIMLISATLLMAACSSLQGHGVIQDRGSDYLKANSAPPLSIPPGMSSSTIHAEYPVSDNNYPDSRKPVSLIPPGLNNPGK